MLYPIIRRMRRPLLPVEEPARAASKTGEHAAKTESEKSQPLTQSESNQDVETAAKQQTE